MLWKIIHSMWHDISSDALYWCEEWCGETAAAPFVFVIYYIEMSIVFVCGCAYKSNRLLKITYSAKKPVENCIKLKLNSLLILKQWAKRKKEKSTQFALSLLEDGWCWESYFCWFNTTLHCSRSEIIKAKRQTHNNANRRA